uniref:Syndecan n=1 Tax=Gasterosteus aculeatus TaxID=69293 RepID=G3NVG6_GASAC
MRNLRLLVLFGLASGFISEKVFVSSQTTFPVIDDLYLEGQTSGELSIDDEDGEDDDDGGSGSGDYGKEITELFCNCVFLYFNLGPTANNVLEHLTTVSWELVPSRPQPSAAAPLSPSTKAPVSQNPATKSTSSATIPPVDTPEEVTSENTWERTDVLAAVIACGVVGFLCAVFLLLLLAYRMKKKDEGSYELGDTKVSTTAYQKAPTKEFYA